MSCDMVLTLATTRCWLWSAVVRARWCSEESFRGKGYVSCPGSPIARKTVPIEKPAIYGPFSLGPGQRVSIGRVTTPRALHTLNGVKRCDPAQGIIDLTAPLILVCVRAQVSPGSIEQ
jgi:hypothetical protein